MDCPVQEEVSKQLIYSLKVELPLSNVKVTWLISRILRYDLTDIARIAFMFNGGQSPASILSLICTKIY